jgi:hypothetical protein
MVEQVFELVSTAPDTRNRPPSVCAWTEWGRGQGPACCSWAAFAPRSETRLNEGPDLAGREPSTAARGTPWLGLTHSFVGVTVSS